MLVLLVKKYTDEQLLLFLESKINVEKKNPVNIQSCFKTFFAPI